MSQSIEIRLPDIGDFQEVDVIEVMVSVGAQVAIDDSLLTLETDKAAMEIPATSNGIIREVKVAVGDKISKDVVLFVLESENHEVEKKDAEKVPDVGSKVLPESSQVAVEAVTKEQAVPSAPPFPVVASPINPARLPLASPGVRRFARELGVDVKQVTGSGQSGRILREDIQTHVKSLLKNKTEASVGQRTSVLPWPEVDFSRFGPTSTESLSRIKKLSGANLHRNWTMIPHVTQHDEADITEMEIFRKEKASEAVARGAKMTLIVFLIKAAVFALKQFPQFNASLSADGQTLTLKHYYHIGVAVDTPEGLLVPVIRDCDQKTLLDLAVELFEISTRAREKRLTLDEMQGGCFTISSLGGIGGTAFTPIINAPEVAILGVSRAAQKPVYQDGAFVPRLILPFSLSYDHRVIDGAAAVRFTQVLAQLLSDIRGLLL